MASKTTQTKTNKQTNKTNKLCVVNQHIVPQITSHKSTQINNCTKFAYKFVIIIDLRGLISYCTYSCSVCVCVQYSIYMCVCVYVCMFVCKRVCCVHVCVSLCLLVCVFVLCVLCVCVCV